MNEIAINTGYTPGLVGRIAELHAIYYHAHWRFDAFFETKVATELSGFINRYDPERDRIWSIECNDRIEGAIAIDGVAAPSRGAHLRWFITSNDIRGRGLGARLINEAIAFCRARDYPSVYLWTFLGLEQARHLYEKNGFRLAEEAAGDTWGVAVTEQRYELSLAG